MKRLSLLVPLAALALAGCMGPGAASSPSPIEAPGGEWIRNPLDDTAIFLVTDDKLGKLIDIQSVATYSTHEGGLKAVCQFRNLTPQPLAIQIRALFRKADGTTLEESPWKSVLLPLQKAVPFETTNEGGAARVIVEIRLKGGDAPAPPPQAK